MKLPRGVSIFQARSLRIWLNSWRAKKKGIKRASPLCSEAPSIILCERPYLSNFCQCCQILLRKSYFYLRVQYIYCMCEGKWDNKEVEKNWRVFRISLTIFLKNSLIWCKKASGALNHCFFFVVENLLLKEKKLIPTNNFFLGYMVGWCHCMTK